MILNLTNLEIESLKIQKLVNIQKQISQEDVPMNAVFEFRIGNDFCLMGHRYYKEGRKHLTNAILMDPTFILAYTTLAFTYMDTTLIKEHGLENATKIYGYNIETARKLLQIAKKLNPYNQRVKRLLGAIR